jgi:hypothetical protein
MIKRSKLATQSKAAMIVEMVSKLGYALSLVESEDELEMIVQQVGLAFDMSSIAGGEKPTPVSLSDTIEVTLGELVEISKYAWECGNADGKEEEEAKHGELDEWEEWAPVLEEFRTNQKNTEPDFNALARLLRSDQPLSQTLRRELASLLEGRMPGAILGQSDNWQLRPVYSGQYNAHLRTLTKERHVEAALKDAPTVAAAMADVEDSGAMCERAAWDVLKRLRSRQKASQMLTKEYPGMAETPGLAITLLDRIKAPTWLDEAGIPMYVKREAMTELQKMLGEQQPKLP